MSFSFGIPPGNSPGNSGGNSGGNFGEKPLGIPPVIPPVKGPVIVRSKGNPVSEAVRRKRLVKAAKKVVDRGA